MKLPSGAYINGKARSPVLDSLMARIMTVKYMSLNRTFVCIVEMDSGFMVVGQARLSDRMQTPELVQEHGERAAFNSALEKLRDYEIYAQFEDGSHPASRLAPIEV